MKLKFLIVPVLLSSISSFAQSNDGWVSLFNGRDLHGFRQLNGNAKFDVKNGELIGTTVSNEPNSFLATEKEYSDFIMEVELWVDPAMNSGIQVRSLSDPNQKDGRVQGYQIEIDPSARGWSGGIYDEGRRGWLYPVGLNPNGKTAFKNNGWNKYRIECIANTIRTWVNGIPIAHLVDSETRSGFIAFQVHAIPNSEKPGRQVRWRNIRIKTKNLQPSPYDDIYVVNNIANNLSAQEINNGYGLLWDGKSGKGWRSAGKKQFPKNGWAMEDGVLRVIKDGRGGDIVTEKQYGAFELKFDFKLTKGSNSGVKYFVSENEGLALGLEYQILDDANHPDAKMGINGNRTLSSLYDLIPRQNLPNSLIRKTGTWNQGILRVYPDSRIEHWLNGYMVLSYKRGSAEFIELITKSKYKDIAGFGLAEKGRILLQDHGDEVSFRSIKIREL